ncbi:hypothetical protein [Dongia sp.]|uniref:hypothetical protein n=1 Tax=Dongia sp. TaxID=1977262 RepID=UPI0035B0AE5F
MKNDFNSLFFTYAPHADQRGHDDRLLRDIGLTRTQSGELALAEDPTHLVTAPPRPAGHWLRAVLRWVMNAREAGREQVGREQVGRERAASSAPIARRPSC